MDNEARTKAEFRAIRETIGMTQAHMAHVLGVQVRAVKRWESPDDDHEAPDDAWYLLDACQERQREMVARVLGHVDELAQKYGDYPSVVALPYWASQQAYDAGHCDPADQGSYLMVNANNRLVAFALHERGIRVEWQEDSMVPREG